MKNTRVLLSLTLHAEVHLIVIFISNFVHYMILNRFITICRISQLHMVTLKFVILNA